MFPEIKESQKAVHKANSSPTKHTLNAHLHLYAACPTDQTIFL